MKPFLACAFACFLLLGCKEKIDPSTPAAAPAAQDGEAAATDAAGAPATGARQATGPATPARIAEIEADGKRGFWSETTEVCRGDHPRAWLVWNVRDSGAERVVVYVVDKAGEEQHFGQGGPVGEKQTGPWLYPGIVFKLRAMDDGRELGSVQVGEKAC